MKLEFIKCAGGTLVPADDYTADKLIKFKTGCQFPVDIKLPRNQSFHGKVFKFFEFCFEFWAGGHEFQNESLQFDYFRKELTKNAGFYDQVFDIKGNFTIVAKSLSFNSMGQDEFEQCYHALIQAAMSNIFNTADDKTLTKLMGFF
jgi:hypothetical protein